MHDATNLLSGLGENGRDSSLRSRGGSDALAARSIPLISLHAPADHQSSSSYDNQTLLRVQSEYADERHASSSNDSLPKPDQTGDDFGNRIHSHIKNQTSKWSALFKNVGLSGLAFKIYSRGGQKLELEKPIVDKSLGLAIIRSWIHILPILASVTIITINLGGVYVGAYFAGSQNAFMADFYILFLQVMAKLMELLIVASLGKLVVDVIRHQLLFSGQGLPFGLLVSSESFRDVSYYWSPEFWAGVTAFKSRGKRWWIGLLLLVCGGIALMVGPSTALLLIPTQRVGWPAGGMDFYFSGNESSLWPSRMDLNSTNLAGQNCTSPSLDMLQLAPQNRLACPWSGYGPISEQWEENNGNFNLAGHNISISDGVVPRTFKIVFDNINQGESWTQGIYVQGGVLSMMMSSVYNYAVFYASDRNSLKNYNIRYSDKGGTQSAAESQLPLVRTACYLDWGLKSTNSSTSIQYPYLPEYSSRNDSITQAVQTEFFNSSNHIQTRWMASASPPGPSALSNGSREFFRDSAFLSIQLPSANKSKHHHLFVCTIDARWAQGVNIAPNLIQPLAPILMLSQVNNMRAPDPGNKLPSDLQFLPADDGSWRPVEFGVDWLNLLTPTVPGLGLGVGYTSLSLLAENLFGDQTLNATMWGGFKSTLEVVIATIVADGMSRIGYSGLPQTDLPNAYWPYPLNEEWRANSFLNKLLAGTAVTPPGIFGSGAGPLRWTVTVSGLAYKADTVSAYFAIGVLLMHAALAIGYMAYMLCTKTSSDSWESFTELLALTWSSRAPAPDQMWKVSGGIRQDTTLKTMVVVRATPALGEDAGSEKAELLTTQALYTDPQLMNTTSRIRPNGSY